MYRLGESKDNRLRDIVSTIQVEQDSIIRADLNKTLIIQGVPGSGKTTVALHRLAFLLYQYQDTLDPKRMIIFAPNKMFLDYISDVLPELGVEDIQQTTFTTWALEILQEDVLPQYLTAYASTDQAEEIRYKGSKDFFQLIHSSLEEYQLTSLPKRDFIPWEGAAISKETIHEWYFQEYKHYPLTKRKERIITRMKRWIETEYREFRDEDVKGKLKTRALSRLRSYAKSWSEPSLLDVYQLIIKKNYQILEPSLERLRRKEITLEDLAPLLYIHYFLHGRSNSNSFEHVVIDEAQDFSPFQVLVLKKYAKNVSFTILGDLLQNIYHRGIHHWKEFKELFSSESIQYHQLDTSYRSTAEIIHFAKAIIEPYKKDISLPKPVFRSGHPVQLVELDHLSALDKQNCFHEIQQVDKVIDNFLKMGTNTIAVVTRDDESSRETYECLKEYRQEVHLITSDKIEYEGGITVTSISLIKGMEFDAVLLLGVDEKHYPSNEINAKLLYVGCTRALHHLFLFYTGKLSPLLRTIPNDLYLTNTVE